VERWKCAGIVRFGQGVGVAAPKPRHRPALGQTCVQVLTLPMLRFTVALVALPGGWLRSPPALDCF